MTAFIIWAIHGDTFTYSRAGYLMDVPSTSQFFKSVQKMKEENLVRLRRFSCWFLGADQPQGSMVVFLAPAFLGMPQREIENRDLK